MINSWQNPLVKQIRKLHRTKGRTEQNQILIEGTHLVETACRLDCSFVNLCYTEQWEQQYSQLCQKAIKQAKRVEIVSQEVLSLLATTINPDGIIATLERSQIHPQAPQQLQLGLVLERLQDPGNLGTIIRTSVATGVDQLWLSQDSVEIDNPKVIRASAGEWFRLPMGVVEDLPRLVRKYHSQGVQIVATLPDTDRLYWDLDFTQPTLLLLGNEGAGLSQSLIDLADHLVKIPLANQVESLNVAIATSVLLYEFQRQNRQN
jgi:TrmH family RNA methyltransferase